MIVILNKKGCVIILYLFFSNHSSLMYKSRAQLVEASVYLISMFLCNRDGHLEALSAPKSISLVLWWDKLARPLRAYKTKAFESL